MTSMITLLLWFLAANAAGIRTVRIDPKAPVRLTLNVAPNVTTTVRFSKRVNAKSLALGDPDRFEIELASPSQLNAKALSRRYGYETNLNLATEAGDPLVLRLVTVATDDADNIVTIEMGQGSVLSCDEQLGAAVQNARAQYEQALLQQAASALAFRQVDARAVKDGVILKLLGAVAIGDKMLVRFAVQNRSKAPWCRGSTAIIERFKDGVRALATTVYANETVANTEETISAALSVAVESSDSHPHFILQVKEKTGTRNIEINDFSF